METPFALLMLGIGIDYLFLEKQSGWLIIGITVFITLEFIIFAIILSLSFMKLSKKNIRKSLVYLLIPTIILSGIIFFYYGTLIPNTIIAKQLIYKISSKELFDIVIYNLFPDVSYLVPYKAYHIFITYQILFYLIIIILSFTAIGIPWIRYFNDKNKKWGLFIFTAGIGVAVGYILNRTLIFDWYVPLFAVPIMFGIFSLSVPRQPLTLTTAILLCILPISVFVNYFLVVFVNVNYLPAVSVKARVERYTEVGTLLNEMFPNKSLLTSEIGALGFSYKGKIFDGEV